jgi:phage terminase large subunit-like protein
MSSSALTSWRRGEIVPPDRLADFEAFCRLLTLDSGRPLVVEPFQRTMLGDFFAGARETLCLLPKGNGKTTLLGSLALFELVTRADSEVVIAAASRDQAAIMLRQAEGFVRRSDGLRARLRVKVREVVHPGLGGRLRILAADADTGDGTIPTLCLVDELHRHKSGELYAVLRDSLSKRDGQMVTISTAGSDQDGPLWRTRQAALERGAIRDGAYLRGGGDGPLVHHEWSLIEGHDDPDDLEAVKAANPASFQTVDLLRERHDSPSTAPWDWRRFACNLWASAEVPWLPAGAWDACRDDGLEIPVGGRVWLGVDIGRRFDASAVVACAMVEGRIVVRSWVLESPGTTGEQTDLALVEQKIRDVADRYSLVEIAYDPWSFERSAQLLADEGLPMVTFPQTHTQMCPASSRLLDAIKAGRVAHNGDPILAAHVEAGVITEAGSGWRLTKRKSRAPMDALIALAMALTRCELGAKARRPLPVVVDLAAIARGEYDDWDRTPA